MKKLSLLLFFFIHILVVFAGPDTAIVIIDMQDEFVTNRSAFVAKNLIAKQIELLEWGLEENLPLLVFEYDQSGRTIEPIRKLAELFQNHAYVTKFQDGGFYHFPLNRIDPSSLLRSWGVSQLIISGVNGPYCVLETTQGAINNGFIVHTSPDLTANLAPSQHKYPDCSWWWLDEEELYTYPTMEKLIDSIVIN